MAAPAQLGSTRYSAPRHCGNTSQHEENTRTYTETGGERGMGGMSRREAQGGRRGGRKVFGPEGYDGRREGGRRGRVTEGIRNQYVEIRREKELW